MSEPTLPEADNSMDDVVAARQALQDENARARDQQRDNNTGNAGN